MNDYLMGRIAADRRSQLEREAGAARLAASARRPRPRTTMPTRRRGVRAQLEMILGRSAV
jgi:hypothetical protein